MSSLSISSYHHQSFADRFKKLDTDSDGKISKEEFVAGAPKGSDSTQASSLYDQLVQAASSSSTASASSDSSSTGLSASDLQTAFQSLSGSTRQAMFQMHASGQYGPPPPPPSDQSAQDTSTTDQSNGTTNPPSINDLLKHISDDLDQILASSSNSATTTSSASTNTTTAASSSDSPTDTGSSSTDQNSTSVTDELSVISKQLEKLLAARKTYGMANTGFAPFMGTSTQAAA